MGQMMKKLMSSTKIAPWALIGGVALGTFGAVQARADTTDELLELLKRKGAITKKEYSVIKTRHAAEKASGGGGAYIRGEGGPTPRYVTALDKGIGIRIPLPGVGIGLTKGEVPVGSEIDVTISGNVNAFYIQQKGKVKAATIGPVGTRGTVAGGIADSTPSSSSIRSGLLPTAIVLDIATKQEGFDISGTLGFYTGVGPINTGGTGLNAGSGAGFNKSFATPGIDVKLAYAKVGTQNAGTFEFGRDFNLFGQDILIFDQNELAVGLPGGNLAAGQNTLGNIGAGYLVEAFIPQFRYTTPKVGGFDITVAVEQANDASSLGTIGATSGGSKGVAGPGGILDNSSGGFRHDQPRFDARLKYVGNLLPNAMLTAWATGTTQELEGLRSSLGAGGAANSTGTLLPGGKDRNRAYGGEAGAKINVGSAEVVGYGYYGKGIGTTGLFFGGLDNRGNNRNSYGYLAQASYTFFDRLSIAAGYGISYLQPTAFDKTTNQLIGAGFGTLSNVKTNQTAVGTVRYKVTKWLNLVGQYAHGRSKAISGAKADSDAVIGGAQIFF